MRIQKSTDKEDFGRKGLFGADSIKILCFSMQILMHFSLHKLHQMG
ncbi:MAG: hypothetical protein JJU02_06785 [Cryomorphaceae bacterium]|nr:hypothetical protein [Cryomorphaceae bacterium]